LASIPDQNFQYQMLLENTRFAKSGIEKYQLATLASF
jgi:hypothetical protein